MIARRACRPLVSRERSQLGQGLVEYGLILALSALLAAVILVFFGEQLGAVLAAIAEEIDRATR